MRKETILLVLVLVIGAAFRLWGVGSQELVGDEGVYAFRSLLYLDYLGTSFQTQPVDWYKDSFLPSWTSLSFHDHPPLGFLIRHIFFRAFGSSSFAARLPGIIFGLGTALLAYLIVLKNFDTPDEKKRRYAALLTAFVVSVSGAFVWISRAVLLEPILIFFIALNIYFFFEALRVPSRWFVFGASAGLMLLIKYTAVFILPAYLTYLILFRRQAFRDWRFYAAILFVLVALSPVIVYNINLYKARGHFDLQIAYLLNQPTPEWTGLVGKSQYPFKDIGKNLLNLYGWSLIPAVIGLLYLLTKMKDRSVIFIWFYVVLLTLALVFFGSADRFLVLYTLPLAFASALLAAHLWGRGRIFRVLAVCVFVIEISFSVYFNFIKPHPDFGLVKLDRYFTEEFRGKQSAVIPAADNPHFSEIIKRYAAKDIGREKTFSLIVYDDKAAAPTVLWAFEKRLLYEGIPVFYVENFIDALNKTPERFRGFTAYFVEPTEHAFLNPFKANKTQGADFENGLKLQGLEPAEIIYGKDNLPMFRIYKFTIEA